MLDGRVGSGWLVGEGDGAGVGLAVVLKALDEAQTPWWQVAVVSAAVETDIAYKGAGGVEAESTGTVDGDAPA